MKEAAQHVIAGRVVCGTLGHGCDARQTVGLVGLGKIEALRKVIRTEQKPVLVQPHRGQSELQARHRHYHKRPNGS